LPNSEILMQNFGLVSFRKDIAATFIAVIFYVDLQYEILHEIIQ